MEFHEAANIFPMDESNIGELAADIRKNGQMVPIETLDGKILDGRRRYMACGKAKVSPKFREVSVADPVAYVLSLNLHRRHLTASQRSMVGARAKEIYSKQAKERQKMSQGRGVTKGVEDLPHLNETGKARDKAGAAVGVSGKLIDNAAKVIDKGVPELERAVDEGRLSVSSAAEVADLEPDVQKEIADKSKFQGGRFRKPKIEREPELETNGKVKGVGVLRANEAINCLMRIPKNDALRKRGFQVVTDWIKHNR